MFNSDLIRKIERSTPGNMYMAKSFIADHPTTLQIFIYAGVIFSFWLLELWMLMPSLKSKLHHTATNILFIVTSLPVQLAMTVLVIKGAALVKLYQWGLLNLLPFHNSIFVKYVIGFFALDFCEYLYHVIMHKTKLLWKFHLVHHTDQMLDVSSTVREHPCETLMRMLFLMLWISLSGASFELLLIRQTIQSVSNITSHTQFWVSEKVEKMLGLLLVTPNFHKVHHHYQLPYTDCNYGDVLNIWDKIFGTYSKLDASETVFGIDTEMDKETCQSFAKVFKLPFREN